MSLLKAPHLGPLRQAIIISWYDDSACLNRAKVVNAI